MKEVPQKGRKTCENMATWGAKEDVKKAYVWLRDEKASLHLSRFSSADKREEVVIEMLKLCSPLAPSFPFVLVQGSLTK